MEIGKFNPNKLRLGVMRASNRDIAPIKQDLGNRESLPMPEAEDEAKEHQQKRDEAYNKRETLRQEKVLQDREQAAQDGRANAEENLKSFHGDLDRLQDYKRTVQEILRIQEQDVTDAEERLANAEEARQEAVEADALLEIQKQYDAVTAQMLHLEDALRSQAQYKAELAMITREEKKHEKEINLKNAKEAAEEAFQQLLVAP